ncbi:nuclear transport factor 2 family protein [Rouxiella sp. Mn2063]|uniref:nuclear transport factor 2 family protein n=1 Tax=Rouxiella sp. Mn2063 TaxID=3395262 RepID=UPI003BDBB132
MTLFKKLFATVAFIALTSTVSLAVAAQPSTHKTSLQEHNKEIVLAFYNAALNEKNIDKALSYLAPDFKQHNPTAEDGPQGVRKFLEWVKSDHPNSHSDIKQVFTDGNYVILNVHMVRFPGQPGLAIAEFFRLKNGKIAEHWDRIQAIPDQSKNTNTMF